MQKSKILKKHYRICKTIKRVVLGIFLAVLIPVTVVLAFALGYFQWAGNSRMSYDAGAFCPGDNFFLALHQAGPRWSVGFAKAVITPEDAVSDKYFLAGCGNGMHPDEVFDDLYVRAVYLDDNTGRGGTVFCVIDCIGLSNHDVLRIRRKVAEYNPGITLKAVNVSSTHTLGGIDTQGLWGEPFRLKTGLNEEFQNILIDKAAKVVAAACVDAKEGKLYAGRMQDATLYHDNRTPGATDIYLNCMKFVPDGRANASLYIVNAGIHPGNMAEGNTSISADFPAYMGRYLADHASGAEFIWITGAQDASVNADGLSDVLEDIKAIQADSSLSEIQKTMQTRELRKAFTVQYGERIGEKVLSITDYREIEPLLNIRIRKVLVPVENFVLIMDRKTGLINTDITLSAKGSRTRYSVITEAGIMKLGSFVNIALCPGELSPEIAVGGFLSAEASGNGYAMDDVTPLYDMLGAENMNMVFGLTNDQIGYIIPDNDFVVHPTLPYIHVATVKGIQHYEETVSTGRYACRVLLDAWKSASEEMNVIGG
jgi:hypothetical protein